MLLLQLLNNKVFLITMLKIRVKLPNIERTPNPIPKNPLTGALQLQMGDKEQMNMD